MTSPRLLLHALLGFASLPAIAASTPKAASSQAPANQVTTWRYDIARTGQNLHETQLTPQNVNTASFGKIASYPVDGYVYAQPLYLPGLVIAGETRNVVFVATEHDSVYAFDTNENVLLWKASVVDTRHGAAPGATSMPIADVGNHDLVPEVGITATPVIDPATGTIYIEAKSKENGGYVHRLHALDVTTGNERPNSPVVIQPSIAGTGAGSSNGVIAFQPEWQMCRPGLLLFNGKVYMAFASHGDNGPYHGWVLGYDATTLTPAGVYNTAPNGSEVGIWQSGAGLAAEPTANGGRMFVVNGNGESTDGPPYTDTQSYGNAIERLDLGQGIHVADQWTPWNTAELSGADADQGSGGIILLPDQPGAHPHELVQVGKNGRIEVLDRDNLGGFNPSTNNIAQELNGQTTGLWSTPAYWNGNLYLWGRGDFLKQFSLTNGQLSATPVKQGPYTSDYPGISPVVSANGATNGILWGVYSDAYWWSGPALLVAFDATDVSKPLYASWQNAARDQAGPAVKFTVPVVVDGKVFVGTENEVDVYGLLASVPATVAKVQFSPTPGAYAAAQTVTLSDPQAGATIYYTTDGTTPTPNSTRYTGPLAIAGTTAVEAIATAPGLTDSGVVNANYTIGNVPAIDFSNGFSSVAGITLNGSAVNSDDSRLQLTTGANFQAGSAFWSTPVNVQSFFTSFTFQLSGAAPLGDGFTFTLQNNDPHALGENGGGLGYGSDSPTGPLGIANSIAIKFDLANNQGEGSNSTGLYVNGASPTVPSIDLTNSGIDLSSGDTFRADITYDGTTLVLTISDPVAKTLFTQSFPIFMPQTIGGNTAYAGFTAGTSGNKASQKILTWTYIPAPDLSKLAPLLPPTLTPAPGSFSGPQTVSILSPQWDATVYYTTDGTVPTIASAKYTGPIQVSTGTTLQAIAVAPGLRPSSLVGGRYTIAESNEPSFGGAAPEASGLAGQGTLVPAAADFNGDGKMDLAVISASAGSVDTLLGNGDGTFEPAVSHASGKSPSGLATGDLNHDGKADLAIVNKQDGTLAILLNNGDGTFPAKPSAIYPVHALPMGVLLTDTNGDGILDAVVSYNGTGNVGVLLGKGDGTFQPEAAFLVASKPYGAVAADLNNDGLADLLVWNSAENTLGVLLNDGTGKFLPEAAYATGSNPSGVATADFNGDGFPDAAVANLVGGTLSVLLNDGTGKLLPQVAYATGNLVSSIVAADMNGDGVPDLIVTNMFDSTLGILLGKGDGTFLPQTIWPLAAHPYIALAADFNGDGQPDLAITNAGAATTVKTPAGSKTVGQHPQPAAGNPITVLLQNTAQPAGPASTQPDSGGADPGLALPASRTTIQ